jgi:hypothetical protein
MDLHNHLPESPTARKCYWIQPMTDDEDLITATTARAIDDAMPAELPRPHLGMSQIGKADDRALWLSFRWSLPDDIEPRVRRIFRLGHVIETGVLELLARIPGAKVLDRDPKTGQQFRFEFIDGHFGGSTDACMLGVPEAPKTWHVVEIKTVNSKRFKELQKVGVEEWSQEYWAQMQCYMGASGMDRALFVAYNKDTSEIYTERVRADKMAFSGYLARAERIIMADKPPLSVYSGPDDFEAKKHGATSLAYWGKELPPPNCRNCVHSSPGAAGLWDCDKHLKLKVETQRKGCPDHLYIPEMVPAHLIESWPDAAEYATIDGGVRFYNVESDKAHLADHCYDSRELEALTKDGKLSDRLADVGLLDMQKTFDARHIK